MNLESTYKIAKDEHPSKIIKKTEKDLLKKLEKEGQIEFTEA